MRVAFAMDPEKSTHVDAKEFPQAIAIAWAISSMHSTLVAGSVGSMKILTASVMTSTNVWVNWTHAVCAMVKVMSLNAVARTFP
jgi:hypothetical protein